MWWPWQRKCLNYNIFEDTSMLFKKAVWFLVFFRKVQIGSSMSVWPSVFSSSLTEVDLIMFSSNWALWQEDYVPFLGEDSKVSDQPQVLLRRSPFMPINTMMSPKNPLAYNLIHPSIHTPSKESDFSWVAIHDSIYCSWLLSLPWGWWECEPSSAVLCFC